MPDTSSNSTRSKPRSSARSASSLDGPKDLRNNRADFIVEGRRQSRLLRDCQARVYSSTCPCDSQVLTSWRCKSKWCPDCLDSDWRGLFFRRGHAIARFEFLSHVILTVPSVSTGGLRVQVEHLLAGFYRLRKTTWWSSKVRAGCRALGLTFSSRSGWHAHLHLAVDSAWLDQRVLGRKWKAATRSTSTPHVWVTRGHSAYGLFHELLVGSKDDAKRIAATSPAVRGEAALAMKGRRRFQLFGDFSCDETKTKERATCPSCGARFDFKTWARAEWRPYYRLTGEAVDRSAFPTSSAYLAEVRLARSHFNLFSRRPTKTFTAFTYEAYVAHVRKDSLPCEAQISFKTNGASVLECRPADF